MPGWRRRAGRCLAVRPWRIAATISSHVYRSAPRIREAQGRSGVSREARVVIGDRDHRRPAIVGHASGLIRSALPLSTSVLSLGSRGNRRAEPARGCSPGADQSAPPSASTTRRATGSARPRPPRHSSKTGVSARRLSMASAPPHHRPEDSPAGAGSEITEHSATTTQFTASRRWREATSCHRASRARSPSPDGRLGIRTLTAPRGLRLMIYPPAPQQASHIDSGAPRLSRDLLRGRSSPPRVRRSFAGSLASAASCVVCGQRPAVLLQHHSEISTDNGDRLRSSCTASDMTAETIVFDWG